MNSLAAITHCPESCCPTFLFGEILKSLHVVPKGNPPHHYQLKKGKHYQNFINGYITPEGLSKQQPEAVFCGDDHDYCHISQKYKVDSVTKTAEEYSVKFCAMNMGINYAAIQLISL